MIAPVLDDIAPEYQGKLKIVKVNVDDNQAVPSEYGVRGIPTLMIFKNGENVATKVGALAKGQLLAFIDASIAWLNIDIHNPISIGIGFFHTSGL